MLLNRGCMLVFLNGNLYYCNKDPLEEVQGTGGRHAGHAGAIDGTQMNPRHVEADCR